MRNEAKPMNSIALLSIVCPKIEAFITALNGRFKDHVSDEFIKAYITRQFYQIYHEHPYDLATNLAYNSCVFLFENLLEYGCKARCNGHHVAQSFCEYFKAEPLQ